MGNSTVTVQSVVDFARTIPDLSPVLPVGGYGNEPALTIANEVLAELIAERFNWKWNRILLPGFVTIPLQQDYAQPVRRNIGWLEAGYWVDINNTSVPKPLDWIECVRDLKRTSNQYGARVQKACWLPNDELVQDVWPGGTQTYINPLGAVATPANPPTNIRDASGNILALTHYGITGNTAPDAGADPVAGTVINDGSCQWTVCDPKAQGYRVDPLPAAGGPVYQINLIAQAKAPALLDLEQTIDPIPDDYAQWFRSGFMCYCHRHSVSAAVQARFEPRRRDWIEAMVRATRQGNREKEDNAFVPDHGLMTDSFVTPIGPGWPFGGGR